MKLLTLLISLSFFSTLGFGQELSRTVLTTAGDFSKNKAGITVDWTIGEVFSQTVEDTHHFTEGFQQGQLVKQSKLREEAKEKMENIEKTPRTTQPIVSVTAYPNPTTDYLTLEFGEIETQTGSLFIYDNQGKQILEQRIQLSSNQAVTINEIADLAQGNYVLVVMSNGHKITTQSIVKM